MVETSGSLHYNAVSKRYEARREHSVDPGGKKQGRNGASTRSRTMCYRIDGDGRGSKIDTDYQTFVLHMLSEYERNDRRRNGTVKKRTPDTNLGGGSVGTNHDDVLPVLENCEIDDRGKRERENVDEDGSGSDYDPEFLNVLGCLKEYGNAYALVDENNGLIIYEGECSSDDESERTSPRETRMNHEREMNVDSIDEIPRVDLVVKSVSTGEKGISRKRKNDGMACTGTTDRVAVQENSRKVLNKKLGTTDRVAVQEISRKVLNKNRSTTDRVAVQENSRKVLNKKRSTTDRVAVQRKSRDVLNKKRRELASKRYSVEKTQRTILKKKNVVQKEVEEEEDDEDSDDDEEDSDSGSDADDYDGRDSEDENDYEDACDYDDDCDDDYNYHIHKEYSPERNLRKKLKGKNVVREDDGVKKEDVIQQTKKYLNRRFSHERPSLGKSNKIPSLGKSNKMDKGKNVMYEDTEGKAKPNKWFKKDNRRSLGPSRPYKEKIVQSGKPSKENVKQEKVLEIAVEKRVGDSDSDEIEILDSLDVIKKGSCFVPSKNIDHTGGGRPNGCADYRQRVLRVLKEPYDSSEYRRLSEEVNVYLATFPDLKKKLAKNRYWVDKRLPILRGFFYWLQKSPHDGAFKPWKDSECLSVNLKTSNA